MPMLSPSVGYDSRCGFTKAHWDGVLGYADQNQMVLMFRAGKQASIRWIEQRFPAKPMALKIKTDAQKGLLFARERKDKDVVGAAGHWVLREDPRQPGQFIAYSPLAPDVERARFSRSEHPWAETDVVICRTATPPRPFTSDYDLSAIIPQRGPYKTVPATIPYAQPSKTHSLTSPLRTGKALFEKNHLKDLTKSMMDRERGWSNPWVEEVRSELNHIVFHDERIPHGSQILNVNPDTANSKLHPQYELGNEIGELLIAFCPGHIVQTHIWEGPGDSPRILGYYMK